MRKNAMLTGIKDVSEDEKMQKLISLKNKHFFGNGPDKSVFNAVFFGDVIIHNLSLNAFVGRLRVIFFGRGEEQWRY
jgi:hypothetical protein